MASPSFGSQTYKVLHPTTCMYTGFHTQSLKYIPRERSYSNQTFGVVAIQIHTHSTTDIKHILRSFHNWHNKLSQQTIKVRNRVLA